MSTESGNNDPVFRSVDAARVHRASIAVDFTTGALSGERIQRVRRHVRDLKGFFLDEEARLALEPERIIYRVESFSPLDDGKPGGLFWGTTFIEPGMVGNEYFMTKGHFHAKRLRAEYYLTVAGRGALILMDESRTTTFESMSPGSLHYIPSNTAHRVANVGDTRLSFMACWPSDAGHDYESIVAEGFSARLLEIGGMPTLVEGP